MRRISHVIVRTTVLLVLIDIMEAIGIDILFSEGKIKWNDLEIEMREEGLYKSRTNMRHAYQAAVCRGTPTIVEQEESLRRILDADYSAVDVDEMVAEMSNISLNLKKKLKRTLHKFPELFKGGLGTLNGVPKIHLELKEEARPHHARAYRDTTKKEVKRLVEIGVLKKINNSEWAAPTFIQPKKTGDVRVLTDFRKINAVLKRHPFPVPKMSDMFLRMDGFKCATAIDLSMGYYHWNSTRNHRSCAQRCLRTGNTRINDSQWGCLLELIYSKK